jgi:hypothetical protein
LDRKLGPAAPISLAEKAVGGMMNRAGRKIRAAGKAGGPLLSSRKKLLT